MARRRWGYSPDSTRFVYVPNLRWQDSWKRYRGGQATPVYIVTLSDLSLEKLPRENSNDFAPVWMGDTVYFLSDRNGAVTLFAYDTKTKSVKQAVENKGLDLKSLSAGPDALVYEQFGGIYVYDPQKGESKKVDIHIAGDLPATRPHFEKVADKISGAAISPSGTRAVFEAARRRPCRRKRATNEPDAHAGDCRSRIRRGRRTASRWRFFRMNRASMRCTWSIKPGWER